MLVASESVTSIQPRVGSAFARGTVPAAGVQEHLAADRAQEPEGEPVVEGGDVG